MKRVMLTIAYDGTNYCGWQIQINGITVEEIINKALCTLTGEEIAVIGASRTDSGVHALGNVAVFDTNSRIPGDKFSYALNQKLPNDIRIQASREVPADFHPRYGNSIKTYQYQILNRRHPIPTMRLYTDFEFMPLNVEKMQQACAYLVGEHDFKSFCSLGSQVQTTVRTIYDLRLTKEGEVITITISGNGFLYNMVRIIVGTLIKIGLGVYPPEHMIDIMEAKDRMAAGPKAPGQGLTLVKLLYEALEPEAYAQAIEG